MNLKALAQKMLEEGFNPHQTNVDDNGYDNLPDGIYDAILEDVQFRVNDKGTEWISLTFTIINEGYENRKYFANYWLTEKQLEQNIKKLWGHAAQVFNVELTVDDIANIETAVVEKLQEALGTQVELELKTSRYKDKRTGEMKEFQNFKLASADIPF
ncbi:hypothetical protein A0O32_2470 [Anoxybacillus flavithermus]|uniref:hypothetical protein n=1 Tax=Anoxybacillus flavithermus TaxID=33934 RepID=UPI0007D8D014|nr:hypothetical protein [Anoxybacillus flavithermus]OAO77605.1 hypothetical protein A0O32_2470 [Anoxybacillus flavithermus]